MLNRYKKYNNPFIIFWSFIRNLGYLFLILAAAAVVFNVPDQSKDFVIAFTDGSEPAYYLSVAVLLFFWSYITWYSACVILEISPVNTQFIKEKMAERFCLVIGILPSLIMAITFLVAGSGKCTAGALFVGGLSFLFFKWRNRENSGECKWPQKYDVAKHITDEKGYERTPSFMEEIRFIKKFPNVLFYFRSIGIFLLLIVVVMCFPPCLIWITRSLRPASVLMLCLTLFTYVFTVLFYFHDLKTRPFAFIILGWVMFCSIWNDNTRIPVIRNFKNTADFRLTPQQAFDVWYAKKLQAWRVHHKATDTMPVIFIATQGGGIRGEVWTAEVLNRLHDSIPAFYNQVFCIGGASGGTVGAVYYNAFVYDSLHNNNQDTNISFRHFETFAGADCISPVTASFAFGENVQRFLPWPVASLERSKIMMQAFCKSYHKNLKSSLVESSLLSLYYPGDDSAGFNCDIPSLFINGVLAETGQRVITSNLKIHSSPDFENDIDFFDKVRGHISIATASLNCMRFPLLLSGGLFNKVKNKDTSYNSVGHIVDGGYRENTGLQAMYSLMSDLRSKLQGRPIKPILIYIRNGAFEYRPAKADSTNAMRFLHDIGTPFRALLNVNGTSVPALGITTMIKQQVANGNPLNMYYSQVWLKDSLYKPEESFPLGLYISEAAYDKLRKRAAAVPKINKDLMIMLNRYF